MSFTIHDAQIRRDNCHDCKDPCAEHLAGAVDHADPCAACPRRVWHAWGACGQPQVERPVMVVPAAVAESSPRTALVRTLRAWRRAGIRLVGRQERRARASICGPCTYRITHARTGLWGCGAGCNCGSAAVSVARIDARCKPGNWPAQALQAPGSGGVQAGSPAPKTA